MRYDLDFGLANVGQVPTFVLFENSDTGADLTPPTLTERGSGIFSFDWDWTLTSVTSVRFKATCNGTELSDVIVSDAVTTASGVASAGAAAVPWLWTAGAIVNAAAVECGLSETVDPYASTDATFVQLRTLLRTLGHELMLARDWPTLVKECTVTGDGASTVFALPADFLRMKDESGWNRTSRWPMSVTSSQAWQALKARTTAGQLLVRYRVVQGQLQFFEAPASGATLAFDYVSRYWALSSGATSADLYQPASSGDVVMYEPSLALKGLIWRFKVAKGLPNAEVAQAEYREAYDGAAGLEPAPTLSLSGSVSGVKKIDATNVPDTGYGQ